VLEVLTRAAVATGVFAGTNVDDLIVLTVLFLSARATGRPSAAQVWAGQYVAVGLLTAIAAIAALGLTVVPDRYVGLLGVVPLALGASGLWSAARSGPEDETRPVAAGFASVVGVTLANGADNIAVYTPMFRSIGAADSGITIAVFTVLIGAWCAAGSWLGSHRPVIAIVERHGRWIVPVVFVAIGTTIVLESGVLHRL
jgi:cadmium resistance protein CadD (predicted permease)